MSALVTRIDATSANDSGRIKALVPYILGPGAARFAELEKHHGHAKAAQIMARLASSNQPGERVIAWGSNNVFSDSATGIAKEMAELAAESKGTDARKSSDPHEHFVISFDSGDVVSEADIHKAATLAVQELGFERHMYAYAAHDDTDNLHIHLVVSRINPETGDPIKIPFPVKKAEQIGARINHEFNFDSMQNNRYEVNEANEVVKTPQSAVKQPLLLATLINTCTGWQDFHTRTRQAGINYDRKGSGAVLNGSKATDVDRNASMSKLVKRWGQYEAPGEGLLTEISLLNPTIMSFESLTSSPVSSTQKANHVTSYTAPRPGPVPNFIRVKNSATGRVRRLSECHLATEPRHKGSIVLPSDERPRRSGSGEVRRDFPTTKGVLTFTPAQTPAPAKAKPATVARAMVREQQRQGLAAQQRKERDQAYTQLKAEKQKLYHLQLKNIDPAARRALQSIAAKDGYAALAAIRQAQKITRQNFAKALNQTLPLLTPEDGPAAEFSEGIDLDLDDFQTAAPPALIQIKDYDDLRSYSAHIDKTSHGVTNYSRGNYGQTEFIDHGETVTVIKKSDAAVLAALQLAAKKWPNKSIKVEGSEAFKAQVQRLALEHCINLSNPDLKANINNEQQRIKKEQESIMNTNHPELELFKQVANAIPANHWTILWKDYLKNTDVYDRGELIIDKKTGLPKQQSEGGSFTHSHAIKVTLNNNKAKTGLTADQAIEIFEQVIQKQQIGNIAIILKPYSSHIITHIDDVTSDVLSQLINDGFTPSVIIKTSGDKRNVILTCQKDLELNDEENHEINKRVSQYINKKYGDPQANNAVQSFPAPGFNNKKPKYIDENGNYPLITLDKAERIDCQKMQYLALEFKTKFLQDEVIRKQENIAKANAKKEKDKQISAIIQENSTNPSSALKIYLAQSSDTRNRIKSNELPHTYFITDKDGVITNRIDQDKVDQIIAMNMLITGYTTEQIQSAMILGTNTVRKANNEYLKTDLIASSNFAINRAKTRVADFAYRENYVIERCLNIEAAAGVESSLARRLRIEAEKFQTAKLAREKYEFENSAQIKLQKQLDQLKKQAIQDRIFKRKPSGPGL